MYWDLYRDRDKKYWKLCNDPYLKENNITGCSVILILRKANILRACLHWIHILWDPVFESTLASPDLAALNHLLLSIAVWKITLRHQDINSHDIDYVDYVGPGLAWGMILITSVISMWSNDIKCRYMFMFCLKDLAHKGLKREILQAVLRFLFWEKHILMSVCTGSIFCGPKCNVWRNPYLIVNLYIAYDGNLMITGSVPRKAGNLIFNMTIDMLNKTIVYNLHLYLYTVCFL